MRIRSTSNILKVLVGLLALAPCALAARQLQAPEAAIPVENFVEIRDGQFVVGCNKFKVAGWNQWEVVEAAAGAPALSGASLPPTVSGPELVRETMSQAVKNGLNTMRTWVHAVNPQYALQTKPGVYSEATFRGLDYVLEEARRNGLKLILAFTSNWTPTGGVPEYVKWAGATDHNAFYTDPAIKNTYKEFVTTVINRRNTINGRLYKDDPTIMAWDLLNEPRCEGPTCPPGTLANWYDEMATFVKTIDPNHLVTTGEEGFYGPGSTVNPGVKYSEWAAGAGQDFIKDHSSPAIDFATIHMWPDNWGDLSPEFTQNWISKHTSDAAEILNKPLLLQEYGKWVNSSAPDSTLADRTKLMSTVFDHVEQLVAADSALQGSAFWQWYQDGQEAAPTEGGSRGLFGIYTSDDAFKLVQKNAKFIAEQNTRIAGCTTAQHKAVTVSPASDCKQTWVNGLPGTGLEGNACDVNINECVRGTDTCGANAACIDTPTGFECKCYWGYQGDGTTCAAGPALKQLKDLYWTQPKGQSCTSGAAVAWPDYGPGFVYDPMDSLKFYQTADARTGSPTNVTLEECMIACQMADGCESFVYNDVQQKCFLAAQQCPIYNTCAGNVTICASENDRGGKFEFECGYWISYYRLDMDVKAACADFKPDEWQAAGAQPEVADVFTAWQAANPGRFGGKNEPLPPVTTNVAKPTNAPPTGPIVSAASGTP